MLGNLYEALVSGNVPQDKAQKAAEEVASYENRIAKVEADLSTLKWMVGTNIGLTLIVIGKLFLSSTT
jgi:hypothetical protein